jgi:hypothetical protein
MATDASKYLGGMSGQAADVIKNRKNSIDAAVDSATSAPAPAPSPSSDNKQPDTGADGNGRAAPRKRWYE